MRFARAIAIVALLTVGAVLTGCGSVYADYYGYDYYEPAPVVVAPAPLICPPPPVVVERRRPVVIVQPRPVAEAPRPVFVNPRERASNDRASHDRDDHHPRQAVRITPQTRSSDHHNGLERHERDNNNTRNNNTRSGDRDNNHDRDHRR